MGFVCGFFFSSLSVYVFLVELHFNFFHILCDQISVCLKEIFKIPSLKFLNLILTEC